MSVINAEKSEILRERAIRLYMEGLETKEVAATLGVRIGTVYRWSGKVPGFKERVVEARRLYAESLVGNSLRTLAEGAKQVEETREWIEENEEHYNEEDGAPKVVKVRRTVKQLPPNVQAIQRIANKYLPGEYNDASDSAEITIRITQRDRSLTTAERRALLEADAALQEDELQVIDMIKGSDYKELLDPPTKDIDGDD